MKSNPCKDLRCQKYLSDFSPRDKPWDINKPLSLKVAMLYQGTIRDRLAGKIQGCAGYLEFNRFIDPKTGERWIRLNKAFFCRSRFCVVCQWRKSLMWRGRFLTAMPAILRDFPSSRFIFLTLTVRNCDLTDLRSTLDEMNRAWRRMIQRKSFPAIGFARSTEVTRNWDVYYRDAYQGRMSVRKLEEWKTKHRRYNFDRLRLEVTDEAHPHFHALLMVPSTYFNGNYYLSQRDWTDLWQSCLQVDYPPRVDVRAIKPNKDWIADNSDEIGAEKLLAGAIVETFKYSIKPQDLTGEGTEDDRQWLLKLTKELENTRAVALGGVLKNYISDVEPENLIGEDGEAEGVLEGTNGFGWRESVQKYLELWED